MTTELQNKAWRSLPKEFKEEVIRGFFNAKSIGNEQIIQLLSYLFGISNLISNAEVEEMIILSRKQINALQSEIFKAIMDAHDADDWQDAAHYILDVMPRSFATLFGSKCLLDENPNFKVGDKIRHKNSGYTGTILEVYDDYLDVEYDEIDGEYTVFKNEVELI